MQAQARDGRRLWLLTVTAPGERAHSRWVPRQHYRPGMRRTACVCHTGPALADWNPAAGECWNRLLTALRRLLGDVDFYRAAEVQDGKRRPGGLPGGGRGAVHHHVVLATRAEVQPLEVQALASAAGYGCVMDLRPVERGAGMGSDGDDFAALAAYVSKTLAGYVSKSSGANRDAVPWRRDVLDDETGEVRRLHTVPTYKTHTQSRSWGCTVREVLAVQRDQARRRAAVVAALGRDWLPDGTWVGGDDAHLADTGPPG